MKKFFAIALAALLLLSVFGCGKKDSVSLADDENLDVEAEVRVYGEFEYSTNDAGSYEIVGYTYGGTAEKAVEVPSEIEGRPVTGIGADAFKSVATLTAVTIPSSVTYIGDFAFFACTALTEVTIPDSVTAIGNGTFRNCSVLTKVTLSAELKEIGDYAFMDCKALAEIALPEKLETIGDGAFWRCSALGNVVLPASVGVVGEAAYMGCTNVATIEIKNTEIVERLGEYTDEETGLTSYIDEVYEMIGKSAFDCNDTVVVVYPADSKTAATFAQQQAYAELDA